MYHNSKNKNIKFTVCVSYEMHHGLFQNIAIRGDLLFNSDNLYKRKKQIRKNGELSRSWQNAQDSACFITRHYIRLAILRCTRIVKPTEITCSVISSAFETYRNSADSIIPWWWAAHSVIPCVAQSIGSLFDPHKC